MYVAGMLSVPKEVCKIVSKYLGVTVRSFEIMGLKLAFEQCVFNQTVSS